MAGAPKSKPPEDFSTDDFPTTEDPGASASGTEPKLDLTKITELDEISPDAPAFEEPAVDLVESLDFLTPPAGPEGSSPSGDNPFSGAFESPDSQASISTAPSLDPAIAAELSPEDVRAVEEALAGDLADLGIEKAAPAPSIELEARSEPQADPETAPMDRVKRFSEQLSVGKSAVPASYPFSLLITGQLAPNEREKLLDLLSKEDLGIRAVDLEPQFEEGRVLIPRISEYAGILIVQALRASQAQMRLGPADNIFATDDTRTQPEERLAPDERRQSAHSVDATHAAETIPITPNAYIPNIPAFVILDVVTASASLSCSAVEADHSPEYQEMLERLQRELKYKAYRKGASAILNFSVQLTLLSLPSRYRMLVTGSAVKASGVN